MQQQQRVLVKAEHKPMDWGFYLWLLYRRLPLIIVLVVLALIAVGIYAYTSPKFYEAVSLVRLRKQSPPPLFGPASQQQQTDTLDLKTAPNWLQLSYGSGSLAARSGAEIVKHES